MGAIQSRSYLVEIRTNYSVSFHMTVWTVSGSSLQLKGINIENGQNLGKPLPMVFFFTFSPRQESVTNKPY